MRLISPPTKITRLLKHKSSGMRFRPISICMCQFENTGEVASLVAKGAVCDLFGFEKRKLPERFKKALLRTYPAGDIRTALLSNEELATGSRLEIGRKLWGLPERIWIHDIRVECLLIPHHHRNNVNRARGLCHFKNAKVQQVPDGSPAQRHRNNASEAGAAKPCRLLARCDQFLIRARQLSGAEVGRRRRTLARPIG